MPPDAAPFEICFQSASDQTLLVHFGEAISLRTHQKITKFVKLLAAESISGILNLLPAYTSILVKFDPRAQTHSELEASFRILLRRLDEVELPEPRVREIPVCYGGDFGLDLAEVAKLHGLIADEVIHIHSSAKYAVYFLGFVPGFAYLGGLPEQLATPRLQTPRKQVPAGSVAIGGSQTGVYPTSTPGGWCLIGKTPLKLFDPASPHSSFLEIGDQVRFVPITPEEFARLAANR